MRFQAKQKDEPNCDKYTPKILTNTSNDKHAEIHFSLYCPHPLQCFMIDKLKFLGLAFSIFGCLFKIMSWMGATYLIIGGLSLLGIYCFIRVFK